MTPDAAVADLIDALARAERDLPAGSRFRPWIAQTWTELLVATHGGRIPAPQVARLEAPRRERRSLLRAGGQPLHRRLAPG
jgi:hypothetical protein